MAVDDSYTKALLHFNGDNNGTVFTDEAGLTVISNGAVKTVTTQKKFGTASGYFDGVGDYLSFSGINIGTSAFTVDFWYYRTGAVGMVFSYGGSSTGFIVSVAEYGTGIYADGWKINETPTSANTWHHCALVGNGGETGSRNIKMYIDGGLIGTWTSNYNYSKTTLIGADENSINDGFEGYLDEFRFSDTQRWTENFTPPTAEYAPAAATIPAYLGSTAISKIYLGSTEISTISLG